MSVIDSQSTDCFYRIMMVSFFLLLYILFEATPCHAANFLTPEERQWLIVNNGNVRLAPAPDWEPLEFFDENGEYNGMVADYIHLIEKKLNFKFDGPVKSRGVKRWPQLV